MNRKELKTNAKLALKNNWGTAIIVLIVDSLIMGALTATGIGSLFASILAVGLAAFYVTLSKKEKAGFDTYFSGMTQNIGTKFVSMLLVSIFTALWSLLFVIPGIVKTYSYAMTPYILLDKPELSATEAITESRNMMNGHKMELFILDLSFIGWMLLSSLTCGILLLYVVPYINATHAEYYRALKGDTNAPEAEEAPAVEIPN